MVAASSGTDSAMSTQPLHSSSAMSRSWAVPSVIFTPSTYMAHRQRACASVDLPFWRATRRTTVLNLKRVPARLSSSARMRVSCCHGSSGMPSTSWENSMHEYPADVSGVRSRSGGVWMRGVLCP